MIEYVFSILVSEFGYQTKVTASSLRQAAILGHAKYIQEQKANAKDYKYQVDITVKSVDLHFHDRDQVAMFRFVDPVQVAR